MLRWLHNVHVNTKCDCRDSQADPSFVSVALGEFTRMKSRSCVVVSQRQFDSTEIDCAVMSGLTCWQSSIHLSISDIAYRVVR